MTRNEEQVGVLSKSGLEVYSFKGESPLRDFHTMEGISGEGVEARPIAMSSDGKVIAIASETEVLVFRPKGSGTSRVQVTAAGSNPPILLLAR